MEEKETEKITWLRCPRCGGKTRTQIRPHTVLEDFLLRNVPVPLMNELRIGRINVMTRAHWTNYVKTA